MARINRLLGGVGVLSAMALAQPCLSSQVSVLKSKQGWQLLVDGKPYFVKGLCYTPIKVGETASEGTQRDWMIVDDNHNGRIDSPFDSWVDTNRNNRQDPKEPTVGDFSLMKALGCNTLRVYHHASSSPEIQALAKPGSEAELCYNHPPNKALLRQLFSTYGIRVGMGDFLGAYTIGSGADWNAGTDYANPEQRRKMMKSVETMIAEFKEEPFILFWILGNENNLGMYTHTNAFKVPKDYARFVNEVAKRIHQLDPNHPVVICSGEVQPLRDLAKEALAVDIFGVNTYRQSGFGTLWKDVADVYDKPVLLTEYGIGRPHMVKGVFDEEYQARELQTDWCDMASHAVGGTASPANSIGGFYFEWLDNWWQDGDPWHLNMAPTGWNHETNGLASQGDGSQSPYMRQLRKAYFVFQGLWTGITSCH